MGVDFKRYRILGACNPAFSYKALMAEDKIGVMLPCNVLVIEQGENEMEIAAVNPTDSMMAIQNEQVFFRKPEVWYREVALRLMLVLQAQILSDAFVTGSMYRNLKHI